LTRRERRALRAGTAAPFFLRDGKRPYAAGHVFKQPALAETLRRISRAGIKDFYTGRISKAIVADMLAHDGLIRADDLAQIPNPIERKPVVGMFQGSRVMTLPPPGAGRMLIEILNMLEHAPPRLRRPDTPEGAVFLAEVVRRAVLDRNDRPYEPNHYAQVPAKRVVSEEYAKKQVRAFRKRIEASGETTHLSVMDRHGNCVGLTQSIERVYGSCSVTPELGFLYNNYMMAFEHEDIGHPYHLRPNAVPWASVAPTIAFRGKSPWLVIGSPGSERIAPSIAQVLLRLGKQAPYEAVAAPRMYCNLDGRVSLEAARMRDDIPGVLENHGFTIDRRDPLSFYLGCVQLVVREDGESFVGVADPRRDGSAAGPRK
jgi:gamma-glutamyltranspeptidase/glutathione hydrolase